MSTSTSRKAIAAIAQLRSTSSKYHNLLDVAKCARLAKSQGASMLFLPECFGFIGEGSEQTLQNAEEPVMEDKRENEAAVSDALRLTISRNEDLSHSLPKDGDPIFILDGLKTIARESGLWISGGGMHVLGAPADEGTGRARVYNTHVIVDDSGTVRCLYRKIHLFDVSIPGKVKLQESATTAPGDKLVVCDSPIGKFRWSKNMKYIKLGNVSSCLFSVQKESWAYPHAMICDFQRCIYLWFRKVHRCTCILGVYSEIFFTFDECSHGLCFQYTGCSLLMPSAFTVPTGQAHWHTLLRGERQQDFGCCSSFVWFH